MKKYILLIATIALMMFSCKDKDDVLIDDNTGGKSGGNNPLVEQYSHAIVEGRVSDASGIALGGVDVNYGAKTATTNSEGYYKLEDVGENSNSRIWFKKDGFVSTQKLAMTKDWVYIRVDASLFEVAETTTITNTGGKITATGYEIDFPAGSFVDKDGKAISGDVTVNSTPFFRDADNFIDAFPGNFEGRRDDNSLVPIESYGFMDIECSVGGTKVFIADGKAVSIKFKAADGAPATIPMWYYDENKAEWIEDGIATKVGEFYETTVSHFTKWNWDVPKEDIAHVRGRIVDENGEPIKNVRVSAIGVDYIFGDRGLTDSLGYFLLRIIPQKNCKIELTYLYYDANDLSYTPFEFATAVPAGQVMNIPDIILDLSKLPDLAPVISTSGFRHLLSEEIEYHITGKFYTQKMNDLEVVFDGVNNAQIIELTSGFDSTGQSNLYLQTIRFKTPLNLKDEGVFQVKKGDKFSEELQYRKSDFSFEKIDYPNNSGINTFELYNNNIWIASGNSISSYDGGTWTDRSYDLKDKFSSDYSIQQITSNQNGIWILAVDSRNNRESKILKLNANKWELISTSDKGVFYQNLLINQNGDLWVNSSNGLKQNSNGTWIEYSQADIGFDILKNSKMLSDSKGNIYFLGYNKLIAYDGVSFEEIYSVEGQNRLLDIVINNNDMPTLLTQESILEFDGNNWKENKINSKLSLRWVLKIDYFQFS